MFRVFFGKSYQFYQQAMRAAARRLPTNQTMHSAQKAVQAKSINDATEDIRKLEQDPSGLNLAIVAIDFIGLIPGGRILTPINAWRVALGQAARRGRPMAQQRVANTLMHATQLQSPQAATSHISTLLRELRAAGNDVEEVLEVHKGTGPAGGVQLMLPVKQLRLEATETIFQSLISVVCRECNGIAMIGTQQEVFARLCRVHLDTKTKELQRSASFAGFENLRESVSAQTEDDIDLHHWVLCLDQCDNCKKPQIPIEVHHILKQNF